MPDILITIALTLCFVWIVRMAWNEYRTDRIREEQEQYRDWKRKDNLRWYAEQFTEDTRADLIRAWKELDV